MEATRYTKHPTMAHIGCGYLELGDFSCKNTWCQTDECSGIGKGKRADQNTFGSTVKITLLYREIKISNHMLE